MPDMANSIPLQQPDKRSTGPKEPAEQAFFANKMDGNHPEPANASSPMTCCGCFPVRAGIVLILVVNLALGTYRAFAYTERIISALKSPEVLITCACAVSLVSILAYLAMLFGAVKRNVNVYWLATKSNVVLFVVAMGLMIADNLRFSIGADSGIALSLSLMGALILLFGYWTWILYKYAAVMEAEALDGSEQTGGKVVNACAV